MDLRTRRNIAGLIIVAAICCFILWGIAFRLWLFEHISALWWVVLFAFVGALGWLAMLVMPPFWWGTTKFTTPIEEPSHSRSPEQAPNNSLKRTAADELR